MFLSFMNYFAIQCFPDTYNLVREGPKITPHVTDLMVCTKKILGHEGRCVLKASHKEDTMSITEKTTQTAPAPSILHYLEDERSSMSQISVESSVTSSLGAINMALM